MITQNYRPKPKFEAQDTVYYGRSKAIVMACINSNDLRDYLSQGYRYEVWLMGYLYSVPENKLIKYTKRIRNKRSNQI